VLRSILLQTGHRVDDLMREFMRCRAGRSGHEKRSTDGRSQKGRWIEIS
jgi:hypothetical protein